MDFLSQPSDLMIVLSNSVQQPESSPLKKTVYSDYYTPWIFMWGWTNSLVPETIPIPRNS